MLKAFITGLAGTELSAEEAAFLAAERPCGAILFARNLESHDQIRKLVADVRSAAGEGVLVLIDQEGGRVQRLRPPLGRALPPAAAYGAWHAHEPRAALGGTERIAHLLATDLRALGIDTDCAPVADLPVAGSHDIIGDRAFGRDRDTVTALAWAFAKGLMRGGVLPVVKHVPGHGRATADSHLELPVVTASAAELLETDFAPFRALVDVPSAMSAHVVYTAFDDKLPASVSPVIHDRVIRGTIGYDGFLMSDDLNMRALSGSLNERAAAVIAAGSDVALHCSGILAETREVAQAVPHLAGKALARYEDAASVRRRCVPLSQPVLSLAEAAVNDLLAGRSPRAEMV